MRVTQPLPKVSFVMPMDGEGADGILRRAGDRVVMPPCILEEFKRGIERHRREEERSRFLDSALGYP